MGRTVAHEPIESQGSLASATATAHVGASTAPTPQDDERVERASRGIAAAQRAHPTRVLPPRRMFAREPRLAT
jgi:hypothetical protein